MVASYCPRREGAPLVGGMCAITGLDPAGSLLVDAHGGERHPDEARGADGASRSFPAWRLWTSLTHLSALVGAHLGDGRDPQPLGRNPW